jgi:hypothetical protein
VQAAQGRDRIDFLTAFAWAKAEAVEQAEQIAVLVVMNNALVHGSSRDEKGPPSVA